MKLKLVSLSALALTLAACAAPARTGPGIASLGNGPLTSQALVGATPGAISARLGEPHFRRSEPSAEIGQYGGSDGRLANDILCVRKKTPNARNEDTRNSQRGDTVTEHNLRLDTAASTSGA